MSVRAFGRVGLIAVMALFAVVAGGAAADEDVFFAESDWQEAVRARGVDPERIDNPLAFTEEMRAVAAEVAQNGATRERLLRLQGFLFDRDRFDFDYDRTHTLTAREAFEARGGNCVSFTNLFIALSRSIGIPVQPALLLSRGEKEMEGDLVVVNNHIIAAQRQPSSTALFDFNFLEERKLIGFVVIDDLWNTGVYLNNHGTRLLRDGDLVAAHEVLESAVLLAPRFTAAWGNLGVIRRRLGDPDGALEAYVRGLEVDRDDATIRHNVGSLLEDETMARIHDLGWQPKALPTDALGMVLRGNLMLARHSVDGAKKLYQRALHDAPDLAEARVSLARLYLLQGKYAKAERLLFDVLDADPADEDALDLERILAEVHVRPGRQRTVPGAKPRHDADLPMQ